VFLSKEERHCETLPAAVSLTVFKEMDEFLSIKLRQLHVPYIIYYYYYYNLRNTKLVYHYAFCTSPIVKIAKWRVFPCSMHEAR
jgi:hypothetical protein